MDMTGVRAAALVFGILASVAPFSFLLWILYRLPRPIVASHHRWPISVNALLMIVVAVTTALFLERAAVRDHGLIGVFVEFLITAGIYGFGLALLLRQFCGVYEDFVITVGAGGLLLWKTSYTNIAKAETREGGGGEKEIWIETARGGLLTLTLPAADVERFYAQVRKKHSGE
jgi:hypothetical protein